MRQTQLANPPPRHQPRNRAVPPRPMTTRSHPPLCELIGGRALVADGDGHPCEAEILEVSTSLEWVKFRFGSEETWERHDRYRIVDVLGPKPERKP